MARAAVEAANAPRAERQAVRALAGDARSRGGAGLARPVRGHRPRRRDREAARHRLPPRLARRRREGEAREDRRLRGGRGPVEVAAGSHCDPPPRPLRRRRRDRLRRVRRGRARAPRRDREARPAALEERAGPTLLRAEPLGRRRARGVCRPTGSRRRSALRQGAVEPLPARDEAHPLPRRQERRALHVAAVRAKDSVASLLA